MARDLTLQIAEQIHGGQCPQCKGPGPVDVCEAHWAWSIVVMTSWNTTSQLSCHSCAIKKQLGAFFLTGAVGWWGFPFGLIITPVQLIRNLVAMASGPKPGRPSDKLLNVAANLAAEHRQIEYAERRSEPDPDKPWKR